MFIYEEQEQESFGQKDFASFLSFVEINRLAINRKERRRP